MPDFSLNWDVELHLPNLCIHFEESVRSLVNEPYNDFAHMSDKEYI